MRNLMWFTVGFGAACGFCAYTWQTSGLILPGVFFVALFAGAFVISKWAPQMKIAASVCLGISAGLLWFQGYNSMYISHAAALDGKFAEVNLNCTDYSYRTDYGTTVEGFLYLDGKPCRAKFYVNGDVEMKPGDVLSGCFELRVTTEDSEKGGTYHPGKGIFLLGYQEEDAQLFRNTDTPLWAYPAIFRHWLVNLIDSCFPADTAGFAKALLLGDRADIGYELNTAFKVTGIMHIIAVSGLHVTILFTLLNLLFFKRRWLVALFGIPSLLVFAAMVGFTPSITRACIMQCLIIGATLLNREYDGPTELAFAALVMLMINPLVITSISFQLSVGCMVGIFLFQKRIYDWICSKLGCGKGSRFVWMKRWLASSVSVTLSAISLTTPFSAYYFGAVSLVGVLTNLLTLWAVALIFYGIIVACVTGSLLAGLGNAVASVVSWLIRYVVAVARSLSAIPLAAVYTRSVYIVAWLVFCYVLLAVFLFSHRKKPGLLIGCCAFGLVLSLGASWLEPRTDQGRMTVLDVGQGQSIILQSGGKTFLVDCGGSYDEDAADIAAETLLSQGITRIDGLILTHFDRDHAGGAAYLLSRIPADMILVPQYEDDSGRMLQIESAAPGLVTEIEEEIQISFGTARITIYPSVITDSGNEGSFAVLFGAGNCDILITGDRSGFGERILLKETELPQLDVLVAGHHGAADATCEELLAATRPGIVAISVGNNSYGHPSAAVLERLERYGCSVYRTDIHGTITFRR